MTPTPAQIAEWREKFERAYRDVGGCGSLDRNENGSYNIVPEHAWQIYLRARTEQATEIAELKAKLAEVMPLAKFGAAILQSDVHNYYNVSSIAAKFSLLQMGEFDYEMPCDIEATIEQLLKD
jgi:hypothetical protein